MPPAETQAVNIPKWFSVVRNQIDILYITIIQNESGGEERSEMQGKRMN